MLFPFLQNHFPLPDILFQFFLSAQPIFRHILFLCQLFGNIFQFLLQYLVAALIFCPQSRRLGIFLCRPLGSAVLWGLYRFISRCSGGTRQKREYTQKCRNLSLVHNTSPRNLILLSYNFRLHHPGLCTTISAVTAPFKTGTVLLTASYDNQSVSS